MKIILTAVICIAFLISGCYSFTGASTQPHLKTLLIPTVEDNSGFGNARFREELTQNLVRQFRSDNSFVLVPQKGDAVLTVQIVSVTDRTAVVGAGEVETERQVHVTVKAVFDDKVKKRKLWEKSFTQFTVYAVNEGVIGRDRAALEALERISDDVFLATVSGW